MDDVFDMSKPASVKWALEFLAFSVACGVLLALVLVCMWAVAVAVLLV
jgi:hypothetical protein